MYDIEQKSISLRFKKLRENKKMSQIQFAESLGIKRDVIAKIETAATAISSEVMKKVIINHNVNPSWLLTGSGNTFIEQIELFENAEPNVRFLNISAFAGDAIPIESKELSQWIHIPGLQKKGEYYGLNVDGKSMMPTLLDGDFVVCSLLTNVQEQFNHGAIYVIVLHDAILIKRVFFTSDGFELRSDNPLFASQTVSFEQVLKLFTVIKRITSP